MQSFSETGYPLSGTFATLITRDGLVLALADSVMVSASLLCVPFMRAIERGWIPYFWTGCIIQHVCQALYLGAAVRFTFYR